MAPYIVAIQQNDYIINVVDKVDNSVTHYKYVDEKVGRIVEEELAKGNKNIRMGDVPSPATDEQKQRFKENLKKLL